ncbi:hypothetical protein KKD42_03590, partial [Patescibacteria group bacterium]|nr:hypothetical protein [Patescibacteria group bacterium]
CLQRDYSRSVANDPGRHPCLIWNPNPILASYYDTSHYIPTAGYQPPVNAGEYYCLSPANPPFESNWSMQSKTYWDDSTQPGNNTSEKEGDGDNRFFYLPGSLSKFNYDTGYIAGQCHNANTCGPMEGDCTCHDGSSNQIAGDRDFDDVIRAALEGGTAKQDIKAKGGTVESCEEDPTHAGCEEIWRFTNLGRGIDGTKPYEKGYESSQAYRCMVAHTGEDATGPPGNGGGIKDGIGAWDKSPDAYYDYGRFIQTGRGIGNTYMEYFIPVKPQGVAKWLYPDTTDADLKKLQYNALKERNFSQFQFFPLSDNTSIACALPSYYVDGVSVQDWTNSSQVSAASKTAVSNFNRDFDGRLDRSKEDILTDDKGVPIKLPCSGYNDPQEIAKMTWSGEPESGCYYKYWETNYRLADGAKFDWLTIDNHTSFFDRHAIFRSKERNCSKSGFAIRAMFENTEKSQNDLTSNEVTKGKLSGPWNFVGFWITACTVGTNDEAFLYLGLKVKHADICRQLAQVISPYTRESAAFADRVWNKGSFVVPILGYSFVTNNPPFGSALAEGLPGVEPLFQTGLPVEIPSKLKPPTFLGSGVSYSSSRPSPLQNWANLTNIFARVYRVYTYYDAGVPIDGFACIGGVNDGAACPTPRYENDKEWIAKADEVCGGIGSCNDSLVSIQVKNTLGRCNSLSGVNRGLSCGGNFDRVTKDPICHNFAMKDVDGVLVAQKTKCELRSTWQDCGKGYYLPPGKTSCKNESLVTKTAHETRNAFGCGKDAVLPGAGCAEISDYSTDCPLRIDAGDLDCISDPDSGINVGHCSGGYGHANCIQDSDCVFTASQWWGAYDNQTYSAGGNLVATYYPPTGNDKTIQKNVALPFQYSPGKGEELYPSDADPRMDTVDVLYGDKYWGTGNVAKISRFAFPQTKQDQTPTDNWLFQHVSHLRYGAFARLPGYIPIIPLWPAPSTVATTFNAVVPGLCEGPVGASLRPQGGNQFYSDGIYGGRSIYAFHAGLCEGGVREGQSCSNLSDVPGYLPGTGWPHPNTCAPPKDMPKGECKLVTSISKEFDPVNGQTPILECSVLGMGDPFSDDPDLDNNACTRSAGYKPRKDLCGKNLDSEKCLVGYDLGNTKNKTYTETFTDVSLDQTQSLAPTDVTSGFHNPIFLGL